MSWRESVGAAEGASPAAVLGDVLSQRVAGARAGLATPLALQPRRHDLFPGAAAVAERPPDAALQGGVPAWVLPRANYLRVFLDAEAAREAETLFHSAGGLCQGNIEALAWQVPDVVRRPRRAVWVDQTQRRPLRSADLRRFLVQLPGHVVSCPRGLPAKVSERMHFRDPHLLPLVPASSGQTNFRRGTALGKTLLTHGAEAHTVRPEVVAGPRLIGKVRDIIHLQLRLHRDAMVGSRHANARNATQLRERTVGQWCATWAWHEA
mmetsp:Transcript_1808/g.5357  ORF Transcript_1808/g.5357 Transcript_1808/m.5357 type:complete len:265 (-) Transcript_1808:29-823(-)